MIKNKYTYRCVYTYTCIYNSMNLYMYTSVNKIVLIVWDIHVICIWEVDSNSLLNIWYQISDCEISQHGFYMWYLISNIRAVKSHNPIFDIKYYK
jgi:hypothetical protein